jgi:hypothetical protein
MNIDRFLGALQEALIKDPKNRGGHITHVNPFPTMSYDVTIADKNGGVVTYSINLADRSWSVVYNQ